MSIVSIMQAQHRHCDALLAQAEANIDRQIAQAAEVKTELEAVVKDLD